MEESPWKAVRRAGAKAIFDSALAPSAKIIPALGAAGIESIL